MTYVYMGIATVLIVAVLLIVGNWIVDGIIRGDRNTGKEPS